MTEIFDQPTTIERIVKMDLKYIVLTFFDNKRTFCYSYESETDMFKYVAGALTYNTSKTTTEQTPNVLRVVVYKIDNNTFTLIPLHNMEG